MHIVLLIDWIIFVIFRIARAFYNLWADIILAFYQNSNWEELNKACYKRANFYGAKSLQLGLFLWEKLVIDQYLPKVPAKILVLAAGSGREAEYLINKNYTVIACEIVDNFREKLSILLSKSKENKTYPYSFFDIVNNKSIQEELRSDAVLIGHGAISHIPKRSEQVLLLKRITQICPDGVIIFSWLKYKKQPNYRKKWRILIYKLTGRKISKFKEYLYPCGPVHYANTNFMKSLIRDSGLDIVHYDDKSTYAHAVCRKI